MSQHGFRAKYRSSVQEEGTMDLFIETLTGTAFEMTVSPFDTVMSIKSKIQRVEGIPISHQHLLYKLQELDDSSCLIDYSIQDGATLKLVLSMRGGPISTRRLPSGDECAWKELRDFVESNREDMFDNLPAGCRVTVLVFKDGDQVNLFRVIEHDDGTYSPLSEPWSSSSIRNLFAEDDPEVAAKKIHENSITMGKMRDLRNKMEALSLQRKPKRPAPRVLSAKKSLLHVRKGALRTNKPASSEQSPAKISSNFLQLPPIKLQTTTGKDYTSVARSHQTKVLEESRSLSSDCKCRETTDLLVSSTEEERNPGRSYDLSPNASSVTKQITNKRANYSGCTQSISDVVQNKGYGDCNRGNIMALGKRRSEMRRTGKESLNHLTLSRSESTNILGTSNIAILEEDSDNNVVNGDPDLSTPSNAIPVPSKEATAYTISQIPCERITPISSSRYRVSHFVLDDNNRPKTSPDKLLQNEKSAQEMWGILTETKWHRHRRRRCTPLCSSKIEPFGCLPSSIRQENHTLSFRTRETSKKAMALGDAPPVPLPSITQRCGRRGISQNLTDFVSSNKSEKHISKGNEKTDLVFPQEPRNKMTSDFKASGLEPVINSLTELPREQAKESSSNKKPFVRTRCAECRKKLNITNVYTCRCEKIFCSAHRYSELHNCTYDYKSEGRKLLEQANPLVRAPKLPKI